jgi:metal-sulfur cluster biosynthetic enzyme
MNRKERLNEVWAALGSVTDPELDESVTTLEFISDVEIDAADRINIEFTLPTYWCAPNFAFLMASDMRDVVAELPWVESVSVRLLDHFSAELINRGVALKQDFRDAFPGETDDDLDVVRKKFLKKAFERRQELLMRCLLNAGYKAGWMIQVTYRELMELPLGPEGERLRNLYVFAWRRIFSERGDGSLAFVACDGNPLETDKLPGYLRKVAGVRRNAEFNGTICRSLLVERKSAGAGVPKSSHQGH